MLNRRDTASILSIFVWFGGSAELLSKIRIARVHMSCSYELVHKRTKEAKKKFTKMKFNFLRNVAILMAVIWMYTFVDLGPAVYNSLPLKILYLAISPYSLMLRYFALWVSFPAGRCRSHLLDVQLWIWRWLRAENICTTSASGGPQLPDGSLRSGSARASLATSSCASRFLSMAFLYCEQTSARLYIVAILKIVLNFP